MHFGSARLAQKLNDAHGRGAADDGIVDQHDALALYGGGDWVQFDANLHFSALLRGLNERAADVFVFEEAYAVRDAGSARIADRRVNAAVRNADDDVRLNGVFQREEAARALARPMHA